jgi:hypothetical protein
MNSSIYSANRTTHLRVVAVVLIISIAIVALGMSARVSAVGAMQASEYPGQIQKAVQVSREAAASRTEPGHI